MVWSPETSNGDESAKIRWELPEYTRGRVLELGCGPNKAFQHFIGVDNYDHEKFGLKIRAEIKVNTCEKLDLIASQSCDAVFSSHLLEHIENFKGALREWWRVVRPGGHLCLYLPHKDFYPNIGHPRANPDHKHDFLPSDIVEAMREIGVWDLVENQDRNEEDEYSFFQVYRKLTSGKCRESYKNKPQKSALVFRCGAFGDMLQASSVWAGLKKQGYHVSVMCQSPGSDVITHDPNIDKIILLDRDQVPNHRLVDFWRHQAKKYDKFVNLSESVEGTWLALPYRSNHEWPVELRRKHMTKNYIEFQHELAGLPHDPQPRFYPTAEEMEWARKQRAKMGAFVVLWSLSGSSPHKHWPYLDQTMARLFLQCPEAHVVLVGGPECELLEAGWEKEPRVHRTCGKWTIRQSLTFIEFADLVIGPETGVLNAASHRPVPKVLFLSHSPKESLSRDWVNCESLTAKNVKCHPCLQLHHNWSHCWKDEEAGAAMCQSQISADMCWAAIEPVLANKFKRAA